MRPSDVYIYRTRAEILAAIKGEGYRVVAFRSPKVGEKFWATAGEILTTPYYYRALQPRLILERL